MTSMPPEKMCWVFPLLFLASFAHQVEGEDGGLKVQVTQKGLDYAKDFGLEMLKASLKKEQMKDIHGSYDASFLGDIDYSVSGIQVKHLQVDNSNLTFTEGTGLLLAIHNAEIALTSQWSLSTRFGGEDGTVDFSMDLLFLSVLLQVDKDAGGHPRVSYAGCHAAVGDLQLKFYKGNSWLYNLLATVLKGTLRDKVHKHLCFKLKKGVIELDSFLAATKVSAQIDSFVGLNYSVVNKPSFGVDQCNVDLKGEFFTLRGSPKSPLFPAHFQLPNQPDSMVHLGISEFFANSAAFAYFMAGALRVNYTNQMIPKYVPFGLNTKSLGAFIPELKKEFPDMDMEIHITAQTPPVLSIHRGRLEASVMGAAEAFVIQPNASLASAFLLNIEASFTGQVFLKPVKGGTSIGKVGGSLALKSFHLSVKRSSIGEIKVAPLEPFLKIAGQVAVSKANGRLKKGFALPGAYGLRVLDPKVTMEEGYVLIATDLSKEPEGKWSTRHIFPTTPPLQHPRRTVPPE